MKWEEVLTLGNGGLWTWGRPILLGKFNAPKMRGWCQELEAHTPAFVRIVAYINDAGLLLFLRERIGDGEQRVQWDGLGCIQQAAMRVDDDGFAGLPESPVHLIFPGDNHTDAHEDSRTAPVFFVARGCHRNMLKEEPGRVNASVLSFSWTAPCLVLAATLPRP